MKNLILGILVSWIFSIFVSFYSIAGGLDSFIDDTISQMESGLTTTNSAYRVLDLQGRKYLIGGRLSYKVPQDNIQLISFTPPSISAGCGGIDISLGALSYLNFDELVDKLQNALRAAPALAVQLVISNLCEKCAAVLAFLEQVSDIINSLNMDSCSLAKAGIGFLAKKTGLLTEKNSGSSAYEDAKAWMKDLQSGFESIVPQEIRKLGSEIVGEFQSGLNTYDCAVITDPSKRAQCFDKMANTLGDISKGVLHEVLSMSGASDNDFYKEVEDILRGFMGDFVVETASGSGKVRYISPVPEAVHTLSIAFDGPDASTNLTFYPKKLNGTVGAPQTLDDFINQKADILKDAYGRVLSDSYLTPTQRNILASLPVPLLGYFNTLRRLNYIDPVAADEIKDEMIERVASYYGTLAYLNAMLKVTSYIYYNIDKIKASVSGAEGSEDVLMNLDSFKESAKNLFEILAKIKKDLYFRIKDDDKKFRVLVKDVEKKIFLELYKYQYSSSYGFANRF